MCKLQFKLNIFISLILIFIFSLAITLICFIIQPNSTLEVILSIKQNFMVLVYNFLPVLLASLVLFFIFNNVFYSSLLVGLMFEIASIINRYKIIYRDDPFVPVDISLGNEAVSIMSKTNMSIDYNFIIVLILQTIIFIILGIFIKSKAKCIKPRILGIFACILFIPYINSIVYSSQEIYNKLPYNGPPFYVTGNFNSKGFIYCFFYNLNNYKLEMPLGYSKQHVNEIIKKYASSSIHVPNKKPHIIMVMSEAFSDVPLNNNLIFDSANHPMKNFIRISKESLSGHLVVPNFGGGTANTEYDVLTGCMTQNLSKVSTSAFRLVRKNFNSLIRFFSKNEYKTLFIHPGDDWFYNRKNVYNYFGIQQTIFSDKFKKPDDYKGSLVSDWATSNKIMEEFNRHIASEKIPLFNFTVTIQNHMPYVNGKYGSEKIPIVKSKIQLSAKASELLSNYIQGIRDADIFLGRLIDCFNNTKEPVVFVFFGDHLPNLGENYLAYKEIGYNIKENGTFQEITDCHKVPFVIWLNNTAKKIVNIKDLNLPNDKTISANYLGAMLYEILGYKGKEPFYDFLNQLRRDSPIIARDYYKSNSGFKNGVAKKINDYRIWQYHKVTNGF